MNEDRDNTKEDVIEEAMAMSAPENKFAEMNIDQLLSAYAIAFKEDRVEDFREYRAEILERVHAVRRAQYGLKNILL